MNQLNDRPRAAGLRPECAATDSAPSYEPGQPAGQVSPHDGQAPEPVPYVSPPPLPWPRIFPQL
jgi:hypothetical protein